jgi:hypothetical protein
MPDDNQPTTSDPVANYWKDIGKIVLLVCLPLILVIVIAIVVTFSAQNRKTGNMGTGGSFTNDQERGVSFHLSEEKALQLARELNKSSSSMGQAVGAFVTATTRSHSNTKIPNYGDDWQNYWDVKQQDFVLLPADGSWSQYYEPLRKFKAISYEPACELEMELTDHQRNVRVVCLNASMTPEEIRAQIWPQGRIAFKYVRVRHPDGTPPSLTTQPVNPDNYKLICWYLQPKKL